MLNPNKTRRNSLVNGLMILAVGGFAMANTGCDEQMLLKLADVVASEIGDLDFSELDMGSEYGGPDMGGGSEFGDEDFSGGGSHFDDDFGFQDHGGFDDINNFWF